MAGRRLSCAADRSTRSLQRTVWQHALDEIGPTRCASPAARHAGIPQTSKRGAPSQARDTGSPASGPSYFVHVCSSLGCSQKTDLRSVQRRGLGSAVRKWLSHVNRLVTRNGITIVHFLFGACQPLSNTTNCHQSGVRGRTHQCSNSRTKAHILILDQGEEPSP